MTWLLDWLLSLGKKRDSNFEVHHADDDEEEDDEEEEEWDRSLA